MPRKLKLDPIEVELSPEEFFRRLKAVGGGTAYLDRFRDVFDNLILSHRDTRILSHPSHRSF
jgi:hypothetical protein